MKGIWRNRDFAWLAGGQTVSQLGTSVSNFAIPWIVLQLTGSALQMGLAFAIEMTMYLALSLPAGVWADRYDRKRLMMWADGARAILMATVPVAHWLGLLSVAQLYVILGLCSAFSALFDASYVSCLPNVVDKSELPAANSALQAGISASQIAGPAVAGVLVSAIGGANTVLVDALSYAASAASLLAIRRPFSAARKRSGIQDGMLRQIQEGLRYVWSHRLIRTLSLFTLVGNIGGSAAGALVLYRLNHDLHAGSFWSGVAMSGVSIGSLLGSLLSAAIHRKVAMGRIMSAALLMGSIPDFIAAFVPHPAAIAASNVLLGISMVLWNVQSMSLRQSVIPDHLLGRASSSIRLIVWGSLPVGSTLGGAAGQWFGAPAVFTVTGLLHLAVWLVGWRTPLYRAQRPQPQGAAGRTMASG